MRFVRGKWQKIRYHTPESLRGLLSRYFEDVQLSDTTRATVKAVCRKPRAFPVTEYREALENEFNMPYPNGFRHNRHGEIVEKLIELIKDRNIQLEG
jgi:ParB family chromosome partitioning protein